MRQRFYGPDRDPVGRHVGDDALGMALADVLTDAERTALLVRLHGAPSDQLARRIGVPEQDLETELGELLAQVRDSPHHDRLRAELESPHGPRYSPEVWRARDRVAFPTCENPGCGKPLEQKPTGRMKHYCDAKCRQAAYRRREKARHTARETPQQPPAQPGLSRLWYRQSLPERPYRLTDSTPHPDLNAAPTSRPTSPYAHRDHIRESMEWWHGGAETPSRDADTPRAKPTGTPPGSGVRRLR